MRHTSPGRRRAAACVVVVAAASILAGCSGDDPAEPVAEAVPERGDPAAELPGYGLVSPEDAAALAAGGVTVIDVRTPEEYAEGHIDGAQLIDFSSATFADEIAALDPDDEYLVYCRSGNRSGQAVAQMRELGVDRVWDLDGGVVAYTAAGLPLVS